MCEIYIKRTVCKKKCRWKGSETNIWSKIGLHSCLTLMLHHMSSNSFAIPRLNKFEIVSWTILDMNHWIFSTTRFYNCRSNPSSPNKCCWHWAISLWYWCNLGNQKKPKLRTSWTIMVSLTKCPCSW
jgi:hypothetical protein